MKFIGYHGTEAKNIDDIIQDGYNFSSKKEWFGEGIYFFEDLAPITDGFNEAKSWVIYVKNFKHWAIFQAEIESQIFIDLVFDHEHKKLFRETREILLGFHEKSGKDLNEFSDRIVYSIIYQNKKILSLLERLLMQENITAIILQ
jgi:hypothetical protein